MSYLLHFGSRFHIWITWGLGLRFLEIAGHWVFRPLAWKGFPTSPVDLTIKIWSVNTLPTGMQTRLKLHHVIEIHVLNSNTYINIHILIYKLAIKYMYTWSHYEFRVGGWAPWFSIRIWTFFSQSIRNSQHRVTSRFEILRKYQLW